MFLFRNNFGSKRNSLRKECHSPLSFSVYIIFIAFLNKIASLCLIISFAELIPRSHFHCRFLARSRNSVAERRFKFDSNSKFRSIQNISKWIQMNIPFFFFFWQYIYLQFIYNFSVYLFIIKFFQSSHSRIRNNYTGEMFKIISY